MNPTDLARLEAYLRTTLGNPRLRLEAPKARGASVELRLGEEFLGTVHRDEEDGEVSFSIHIMVLDEDLPRMAAPPPAPKRPAPRR